VWTDLDPPAVLLKGVGCSRADDPFADPFAVIGPHSDLHRFLPIIDDFKDTTGFILVAFRTRGRWLLGKLRPTGRKRKLYLNLRTSQQREDQQDNGHHPIPSDPLTRHTPSFESSGKRDWIGDPLHLRQSQHRLR